MLASDLLDLIVQGSFRAALALQAAPLREVGDDMLATLVSRWTRCRVERGAGAALVLWLGELVDLLRVALSSRLPRGRRGRGARTDGTGRRSSGARQDGGATPGGNGTRWSPGSLAMDVKLAVRALSRRPGFTLVAVTSLALGIGATSSVFSVIHGSFLKPLPFEDPSRLVVLDERDTRGKPDLVSALNFEDWRRESRSFEQLAIYSEWSQTLTGQGYPRKLSGYRVSPSLFPLLGVAPEFGRGFRDEEETPGLDDVVVISHAFWRSHFGGAATALGSTLSLDGSPVEVVGIMPEDFRFPDTEVDFYRPFALLPWERDHRVIRAHLVIARLADGVTVGQADQDMSAVAHLLGGQYPATNKGWTVGITPAQSALVGASELLWILLGAVGSVLLIACTNIASLILARAREREREFAVRRALGAGRARMVRELVAESTVLAVLGGLTGLGLASIGGQWLSRLAPGGVPGWHEVTVNWTVVAFAGAVTLLTTALFGVLPAVKLARMEPLAALKEGGQAHTGARHTLAARRGLVVVQIGLAVLLTIGAGLLTNSFIRLLSVEPGFAKDNLFTGTLELSGEEYEDERTLALFRDLVAGVEALPGVRSAAMVTTLPLNPAGTDYDLAFEVEGQPVPEAERPQVDFRLVSPGYFTTMGIPLISGRQLTERDGDGLPTVLLINQALAELFFPDGNPVGQRASLGSRGDDQPFFEIAGVVGDVHHRGLDHEARPEVYMPWTTWTHDGMTLVVRTEGPPLQVAQSVRDVLSRLDPNQVLTDMATMDQLVSRSLADRKTALGILAGVAGLGLLISAVGIYGLMAYDVACRRREIALRMALGAERASVAGLVLRQGMVLAGLGVSLGVLASLALGRTIESLLFQLSPMDPATVVAAVTALGLVALLSCWLPARHAAGLDPAQALRGE